MCTPQKSEPAAELLEHGAHVVVVADGDARRAHEHVGVEAGAQQRLELLGACRARCRGSVGSAPASRHCAASAYEFDETMRPPSTGASGSTSSSPPERIATRGRRWTATWLRPSAASMPSCDGAEDAPGASTAIARAHVLAGAAHVLAAAPAARKRARARPGLDVLLHHDGVGARRDRRPGEDARGLARRGARRARRRPPPPRRRRRARPAAPRTRAREVRRAHRVAVHGRAVGGREGPGRDDGLGEHPPEGVRRRHALGPEHRARPRARSRGPRRRVTPVRMGASERTARHAPSIAPGR